MTFDPLRATCDRTDTPCACEVFVNANETSSHMFYTNGKGLMAETMAALPTSEDAAVNAATATRLVQAATGLHPAGALFHLVHAVRDHLVACRLTPGGQYRLWATTADNAEARALWGLPAPAASQHDAHARPFDPDVRNI